MLALKVAEGPIVATFHTSTTKSLVLSTFQGVLRPYHEKISGRIAVSELARRWQVESLGSDAVEIPNGVDVPAFAEAPLLEGYPRRADGAVPRPIRRTAQGDGGAAAARCPRLVARHPGDRDAHRRPRRRGQAATRTRARSPSICVSSVRCDDAKKASALRSADVYCAPNLGGESFGIVLVEAMAAGAAVVASELDAFRRVLATAGRDVWSPSAIRQALARRHRPPLRRRRPRRAGTARRSVRGRYDWPVMAEQILRVYETVTVGDDPVFVSD